MIARARPDRRRAYRLARRLGALLHAPRAWLNEQLHLVRDGLRHGDGDGLLAAAARRRLGSSSPDVVVAVFPRGAN